MPEEGGREGGREGEAIVGWPARTDRDHSRRSRPIRARTRICYQMIYVMNAQSDSGVGRHRVPPCGLPGEPPRQVDIPAAGSKE
jgi:hypothetical protein